MNEEAKVRRINAERRRESILAQNGSILVDFYYNAIFL